MDANRIKKALDVNYVNSKNGMNKYENARESVKTALLNDKEAKIFLEIVRIPSSLDIEEVIAKNMKVRGVK